MKNKFLKVLKNRLFIFIVTALVFGTIGVSAATYFPSNNVTYDNGKSGLKSTDVQGAIDELYGTCIDPPGAADDILDNVDIVTSGDGLYTDEYEDGRYFYKGSNPNNYVTFNGDRAGWRIISLERDGTIKIIKTKSINDMYWDSYNYDSFNTTGENNWARPATLNTYLNETYYNSMNTYYRDYIVSGSWKIGAITYEDDNLATQIEDENDTKWTGKIGLPTVSEFIRTNSDKTSCGSFSLNEKYYTKCKSTNWMVNGDDWWTLSARFDNDYTVMHLYSSGHIMYSAVYERNSTSNPYGVRPTLYLSSNVKITGSGTQSNPYIVE